MKDVPGRVKKRNVIVMIQQEHKDVIVDIQIKVVQEEYQEYQESQE
jgi:hypothetical protein